jgi:hypothetical protein
MARSEGWTSWLLRVLNGDSPIFVRRKSGQSPRGGQSPERTSRRSAVDDNEAKILGWLEGGEEMEDEEKYWRKTARHDESAPGVKTKKGANIASDARVDSQSYETETSAGALNAEATSSEDRARTKRKTRLHKALSILSDLADIVHAFFKSLRLIDWLLLGAVIVVLVVVVMILFPGTLTWGKAVVKLWKWPWWVWSSIFATALLYLAWLRSRQE